MFSQKILQMKFNRNANWVAEHDTLAYRVHLNKMFEKQPFALEAKNCKFSF